MYCGCVPKHISRKQRFQNYIFSLSFDNKMPPAVRTIHSYIPLSRERLLLPKTVYVRLTRQTVGRQVFSAHSASLHLRSAILLFPGCVIYNWKLGNPINPQTVQIPTPPPMFFLFSFVVVTNDTYIQEVEHYTINSASLVNLVIRMLDLLGEENVVTGSMVLSWVFTAGPENGEMTRTCSKRRNYRRCRRCICERFEIDQL